MMAGENTDFAELDNEPDIGEAVGEQVAPAGGQTPPMVDEDIDIKFVDAAEDKPTAKDEDEGPAREPAGSHLKREQRLKREARARGDALETEVQRLNAENAALRQKPASGESGSDDIDREIEAKIKQFEKVRAEFDPEKGAEEAKLIRELSALEFRKQQKAAGAQAGANGAAAPAPQGPRVNPKVQEWMDKNDWFNNPDYEKETRRARTIDAALHADGYRVEDEDYFEELERRLDKAGVKRPTRRRANGEGAEPQKKDSPVAGGRVDAPTGGKRTVTLTREDLSFMQTCGLDPKNKAHLKEFAMNKLAEARRNP